MGAYGLSTKNGIQGDSAAIARQGGGAGGAGLCPDRAWLYCARRSIPGGMAEWLKALAWKACIRETVSWVRIPLPPPTRRSQMFAAVLEALGWRNPKHAAQWESTLKTYAEPVVGAVSVLDVDTVLIMKILEPIWSKKSETAGRIRERIEAILDGTARPPRGGAAISTSCCRRVLACARRSITPLCRMPEFMVALRTQQGIAARALEFLILTATRTGEVIGARLSEIIGNVWTIPAERMKAEAAAVARLGRSQIRRQECRFATSHYELGVSARPTG